jgi:hypothetical protein
MLVLERRRWTVKRLQPCAPTARCTAVILAAGHQRDRGKAPRAAPGRDSGTVNLVPDVEADCLPDADAPNRDCAGAMARVKAALAAVGST